MKFQSLNKTLLITACAIVVFIIAATAVLFCTKKAVPAYGLRRADPLPMSEDGLNSNLDDNKTSDYTSLGQLRTTTKSSGKKRGVTVVVSPWLAYPSNDKAFYEELDRKNRSIKAIITGYFSRYTERELLTNGEISVKSDILKEINSQLVLGKISTIYFNEYIFLE